jgi:hypothetical protein
VSDFEKTVAMFGPFRSSAAAEKALLAKARQTLARCEVSRWEAMLVKGFKTTSDKPQNRIDFAVKMKVKFNTLALDSGLVQTVLWDVVQLLVANQPVPKDAAPKASS